MAGCLFCFTRRRPFGAEDRSAAVLLQPHIADALRSQSRRDAERLLTGRQRELLRLVAAGHDNTAIARQLGLSPGTVRKHLENAFARLDVSTRTAAVAKVCPDAVWSDPARENDVGGQVVMSGQESHSTGITMPAVSTGRSAVWCVRAIVSTAPPGRMSSRSVGPEITNIR